MKESNQNKAGGNIGKRKIKFANHRVDGTEHVRPRFAKYVATDFRRILEEDPNPVVELANKTAQ